MKAWDVVVVGAGHAGIEAAWAASGMGLNTLLVSLNMTSVGRMSCNPAIGGVSKGNLVVELDALGGIMPHIADSCGIQFRILNRSKGSAVWGLRAQEDRERYRAVITDVLMRRAGLTLRQGEAVGVRVEKNRVTGVEIMGEGVVSCRALVLATGTFLKGMVHIGLEHYPAGRANEPAALHLSDSLASLGLSLIRLKTGTPPRVLKRSVDFSHLTRQNGEEGVPFFSIRTEKRRRRQVPCYLTHTHEGVHAIIRDNIHLSPMYAGIIHAVGPRYCPSIEDKVMRFPHHDRHQVFIEPEGARSEELYLNGLATNMPLSVQEEMLHAIEGLEKAVITRPGYAIEYDAVSPLELDHTLKVKGVEGLYLAGQINGTSGYEEGAVQGFMAGVNAALAIRNHSPFVLKRNEAYIGVLIDDLVLKGVDEPYRMMTARAEYRLQLGFQTAYRRLIGYGHALGLIDDQTHETVTEKERAVKEAVEAMEEATITPDAQTREKVRKAFGIEMTQPGTAAGLFRRVRRDPALIADLFSPGIEGDEAFWRRVAEDLTYRHYREKLARLYEESRRWEREAIPPDLDYAALPGLSREMVERLGSVNPGTLGEAMRIPGITPSAVMTLYVHLKSR